MNSADSPGGLSGRPPRVICHWQVTAEDIGLPFLEHQGDLSPKPTARNQREIPPAPGRFGGLVPFGRQKTQAPRRRPKTAQARGRLRAASSIVRRES